MLLRDLKGCSRLSPGMSWLMIKQLLGDRPPGKTSVALNQHTEMKEKEQKDARKSC